MALHVPLYTVEDLDRFPDDGNRYELLDGVLLVTPAPAAVHQLVAGRIQGRLFVALNGHAHVVGPGAVVRKPKTQLEPDILIYSSTYAPRTDWPKIKDHWLAVEVLSRSSQVYDREFKRDAYFALGVQQVWLVDWQNGVIEVSRRPGTVRRVRDVLKWRTPAAITVTLNLAETFAGL